MKMRLTCLLLAAVLVLGLTGCNQAPAGETAVPTTQAVTEATTEPTTAPTEPSVLLHSGLKEDGSFDSGTLFIGDSMTCILVNDYLKKNDLIGEANYVAKYGTQITAFWKDTITMLPNMTNRCVYSKNFEGLSYYKAAELLGEDATAIYMMWGTNFTHDATAMSYVEIVDFLLEKCPNATVHLQTVAYGYPKMVFYEQINERIWGAYEYYQELGEERVMLIDTFTAIGKNNDEGGIHLDYTGNENWYNAIVAHAEEHGLSQ